MARPSAFNFTLFYPAHADDSRYIFCYGWKASVSISNIIKIKRSWTLRLGPFRILSTTNIFDKYI